MCGFAGFLGKRDAGAVEQREDLALRMAAAIAHRGPDGAGAYADPEAHLALAHRRLAIVDLSPAGHQPMVSRDGRWVIAFNGEIYNFNEVRCELEEQFGARSWRGHSDTEVLVESLSLLGVEQTLTRLNGMFAFAAWDRRNRTLTLARDRIGEKPLYYGWQNNSLLFGSELKALAAHPAFCRVLDRAAVGLYLTYGYVPAPLSIFEGIRKLPPGTYATIEYDGSDQKEIRPISYWTLPQPKPDRLDAAEAVNELDGLLGDAVRLRMHADVPMGAFLSGGIDSSVVVALMQRQASQPVRTFSIGFEEAAFNEAKHAALVAKHLGTDHLEMTVTARDALDVVPTLPQMYDEPFADSSQIPTYLLAKLTRQHVTVALSGDGGDEVFSGYTRYFVFQSVWGRLGRVPRSLRTAAARLLPRVPHAVWRTAASMIPHPTLQAITPHRVRRLADAIDADSAHEFYQQLVMFWTANDVLLQPVARPAVFFDRYHIERDFEHPVLGMSFVDLGSYLPEDILVKLDRATMATSLEGRIPLLDHRVIEAAARLPMDLRVRDGVGKWALRQVLDRYVPRELIDRPKQGFGIPLADWLRGPLKEWASELLSDRSTVIGEMLNHTAVGRVWADHVTGRDNQAYRLWIILMLQAWAREWRPS